MPDVEGPGARCTLDKLSSDTLIHIMSLLDSVTRVTLAAAHPHFRAVLFDQGCATLWGAVPLQLELCSGAGYDGVGGWHSAASCVSCGVSYLDAQLRCCIKCGSMWACKRCFCLEDDNAPPDCANLRDTKARSRVPALQTLADLCRCKSGQAGGAGGSLEREKDIRAIRSERDRDPRDGFGGGAALLTDRWLCSLPPQYRRSITAATTRLNLLSSRNPNSPHRNASVYDGDACCSIDVGLGALIHLGEAVTWPKLRYLQVAETEAWAHYGTREAEYAPCVREELYRFTWDHQLKRLARHMPVLHTLSFGDWVGLTGEYNGLANVLDVKTLFNRLPTVRSINGDCEWLHRMSTSRVASLHCVRISGYAYEGRALQRLLQALDRMPAIKALRVIASGKLFGPMDAIARRAPSLEHLMIETDTVRLRRLRAADAHILDGFAQHEEEMGMDWYGAPPSAPEQPDCKADFTEHIKALRVHPNLKRLSITIDCGVLEGYRTCDGIDWSEFATTGGHVLVYGADPTAVDGVGKADHPRATTVRSVPYNDGETTEVPGPSMQQMSLEDLVCEPERKVRTATVGKGGGIPEVDSDPDPAVVGAELAAQIKQHHLMSRDRPATNAPLPEVERARFTLWAKVLYDAQVRPSVSLAFHQPGRRRHYSCAVVHR
jgi:hypothetical protein